MIYVDSLRYYPGSGYWCHCMCSHGEYHLLEFGEKIGMRRKWLQKAGTPHAHFDLTPRKRQMAIAAGAIEVTSREMLEKCKQ